MKVKVNKARKEKALPQLGGTTKLNSEARP